MPTTKQTRKQLDEALRAVDWAAFDRLTDGDIARQIADNPDAAPDVSNVPADQWHRVPAPDVAAVRRRLGLSQRAFAQAFGVSPHTLRKWEQGQRRPEGPARVLLCVIDKEPEAVRRALGV